MSISKSDIADYLLDASAAVSAGRYQMSPRPKNLDIYIDYIFTEADARRLLLSLTADDFSEVAPNDHPRHREEVLYIFGKDIRLLSRYDGVEETVSLYIKLNKLPNQYLVVISFHKQEYELTYKFR